MEKEERSQRVCRSLEPEIFLQWGNMKRLRCVRVKDPHSSQKSSGMVRRKISSRFLERETFLLQPSRITRNSDGAAVRTNGGVDGRKTSTSSEKEDRYYPTRGSTGGSIVAEENFKGSSESNNGEDKGLVWPKLYISLTTKEKEEDFLAMKGCKPPQRPKKRAKVIQRSLLLVSPGGWLTDMCRERYEVREKKSSKKRPRGLKAMGKVDSDSE